MRHASVQRYLAGLAGALALGCSDQQTTAPTAMPDGAVKPLTVTAVHLSTDKGAAAAINEAGQIVGVLYGDAEHGVPDRAFLWQRGRLAELPSFPGALNTQPRSINNRGQVAGVSERSPFGHAALWDRSGIVDLGTLPNAVTSTSVADAINERGQVVGWSSSAVDFGNDHAVLWENGKITDLGAPPLGVSQATGINNRGEIVGITQAFDALQQAALWANGATVELGRLPGATASHATEINERGQVVGLSGSPDDLWEHAVLWDRGEIIDLGTLPGGSRSSALAISESGAVAGSSDVANGESHAVVWERGVIRDLGAGVAFGINDRGQVVGQDGIGQPTLWTVK